MSLDLIVLVIGLCLYFIPNNGKLNEIGRIAFFAGCLALLLSTGTRHVLGM